MHDPFLLRTAKRLSSATGGVRGRLGPLAVAAVVLLTAAASAGLYQTKLRADATRHERLTERLQAEVSGRVDAYGVEMRALRGVFTGTDRVTREGFRRAVAAQAVTEDFPAFARMGYAQAVGDAAVPAFVEQARADEAPTFRLRDDAPAPDSAGPTRMLVKFAEPPDPGDRILGLDLSREANRRSTALRSVERDDVTVSGFVDLRTSEFPTPSFLLFLPDLDPALPRGTPAERGAALRGWIVAALRANLVLADVGRRIDDELLFAVWDGSAAEPAEREAIFEAGLSARRAATRGAGGGLLLAEVPIGGHRWKIATRPGPGFRHASAWPAAATAGGGLTVAFLMTLLLRSQRDMLRRAAALAEGMTRDLRRSAATDRLTGLPNRARIVGRIGEAIERGRTGGETFAVLFLDFDRFKRVNDHLGHDAGDELLRQIGQRLRDSLRPGDAIGSGRAPRRSGERRPHARRTAARLGGDEFVVLLEGVRGEAEAAALAEALLHGLARPYRLGERTVTSTASIGLALGDASHRGVAEVLREADLAMYEAKREAPGTCRVFDAQLRGAERRRLRIEADLPGAAARGELRLQYQPILTAGGAVESVEALVRWHHPGLGLVTPDEFIPLAEASGEIVPLGAWILDAALGDFAAWRRDPAFPASACVSVNLSRRQLADPTLCGTVAGCLDRHGVPAGRVHLEVTEREVMEDPEVALATLALLRRAGVAIDLDGFGTGQSSLACLHRFPLDVLKVDRAFVSGLGTDPTRTAVFRGVLDLARTLGLRVVAEGVETPLQEETVTGSGCELLQGFGLSRPLDAGDAAAFCRAAGERLIRLAA